MISSKHYSPEGHRLNGENKLRKYIAVVALTICLAGSLYAVSTPAQPDERFKVDVLLIVAHPDDESGISGYLAKLIEEGKRVSAVYLTRGDAGHNNMGSERARSLGLVREMELRHATTMIGIEHVWFLNCPDTPSQNVLRSLGDWHHGDALEQIVRLVRLTRPAIVVTWLPAFRIGENHGDHQASGVIATEAFDISGDPAMFPSQLAGAVSVNEMLLEGLQPWQVQKLYYFSDASDNDQFKGTGPLLNASEISPTRHLPYWRIALDAFSNHLTQYRDYIEKTKALSQSDPKKVESDWADPTQLVFGKSRVKGSPTGDIFEGISGDRIPFARREATLEPDKAALELAGPWSFYETFYRDHDLHLPHIADPQIAIAHGSTLNVPLTLTNSGQDPKTFSLSATASSGWSVESGTGDYTMPAGTSAAVTVKLTAPSTEVAALQEIVCHLAIPGEHPSEVKLQVKVRSGGLPQ